MTTEAIQKLYSSLEWSSSPIDWCEDNYAVTPLVVEFHNCWTGGIMFLWIPLSFTFFSELRKKLRIYQNHISLNELPIDGNIGPLPDIFTPSLYIYTLMTVASLGSAYFHGTLSIAGQIIDELGIMWLVLYCSVLIRQSRYGSESIYGTIYKVIYTPVFLCLYVVVTFNFALFNPFWNHIVCVCHIPTVFFVVYQEYYNLQDPACRKMLGFCVVLLCIALICWILDRSLCSEIKDALGGWYPQLHAWWHVFAYSAYWGILVLVTFVRLREHTLRWKMKKKENTLLNEFALLPVVKYNFLGVPYVDLDDKEGHFS